MGSLVRKQFKTKKGTSWGWYGLFRVPGRLNPVWVSLKTKNKSIAVRKFSELEKQFEETGILKIQEIKFSDFAVKYLEWAKDQKSPGTLRFERMIIKNQFLPRFGSLNLNWLNQEMIERFIAERKKTGVRNRTINLELTLLSVMLKKAIDWGHLRTLPFKKKPSLKTTDSVQRKALTIPEVALLLEKAKGNAKLLIAVLAYTGCRLSEALYLDWSDIDLENETITIKAKPEVGFKPKSGKSRVIPMAPELKTILEAVKEKQGWLFKSASGKRIITLRRGFEQACKDAGLEDISPHCLRHTFASLMIASGADARTLADILGHSSPVITLSIYSHSFDQVKKSAIRRLPSFTEPSKVIPFPGSK